MSIMEGLHTLILGPIELLLDVIFSFSMQMTESPALSIVVLSLAINVLVLPLYIKADAIQQEEREISARLKPRIDRIKRAFTGDERFMMLQTYYRQNHYQPWYALRGSLSLLLQIPFFMAAYNFLSGLNVLRGVALGPIRDLSRPDGLLQIAGVAVNVLPILMTAINIVSGIIYTRGMPLKSKIQLNGMALLFLILLYDSPAGLVFYWTLNNLFSLGKNILNRLPNPKRILRVSCSVAGIAAGVLTALRFEQFGVRKATWGLIAAFLLQLPALLHFWEKRQVNNPNPVRLERKHDRGIFVAGCILMTILTGLLIPSSVVKASPAEFVEAGAFRSPLAFVLRAFLLAAGTFLIWCLVFYLLAPDTKKRYFSLGMVVISAMAILNYMAFGNDYGTMSSTLIYDGDLAAMISGSRKITNAVLLLAAAEIVWILWKKKPVILRMACVTASLAVVTMAAANVIAIAGQIPEIQRLSEQRKPVTGNAEEERILHLDRKGKNVIVLMLDRAIGSLAPYIFQEKPELRDQFAGFVCYPNTLSYGYKTNVGAPPLFGGYEYTPERMNQRPDVLLKDKHNEALKLMPAIFLAEGYEVTVCDPPYGNYQWIPDLSVYGDMPEVRTFITEGRYKEENDTTVQKRNLARERNLFCYSIFRIAPLLIQSELYDGGNYNRTDRLFDRNDYSIFMDCYMVLKKLPDITEVLEEGRNTFLMMDNNTTHELMILQEPAYEPREYADNSAYDLEHPVREAADGSRIALTEEIQKKHYQVNMAAMLQLGKWMEMLRSEGVYDNTRIIIAGDHGHNLGYPDFQNKELDVNTMAYNPLFMVKDFDSRQEFEISGEFMTNADTPVLALKDLVEKPVNPFTGQPVTDRDKEKEVQKVCLTSWDTTVNNGYTFMDPVFYAVRNGDVRNPENWSRAETD